MTKNQILKAIASQGRFVTQIKTKGTSTKGLGDCHKAMLLERAGQIKRKSTRDFQEDGWKIKEYIWVKA